jgi:hypothetical protein
VKIRTLSIVILLLGAAGVACADQDDSHWGGGTSRDWVTDYWSGGTSHDWFDARGTTPYQAPKIDPVSMIAALTLFRRHIRSVARTPSKTLSRTNVIWRLTSQPAEAAWVGRRTDRAIRSIS